MDLATPLLLLGSLVIFAQALFSLYLMLYTWEHPDRLEASSGPSSFEAPKTSFSVIIPARDEEAVIADTVRRVWNANYPVHLRQIIVVCHESDIGTIKQVRRVIREIRSRRVRLATFSDPPINKPHGLNVALQLVNKKVVTIFDAEDDIDPDVFNVANTIMLRDHVGIVQSGVQLMNHRDHWFSLHNCLEYFFWFKSRLHFHARVGMIPLGGNTVFIRRDLIERVGGWDEACLTEDADIGLRVSTLGERIRVVYDAQHVTREETPSSVAELVRQRTRWHQGFLQVLRKGSWLELTGGRRRLLAFYTFSYPLVMVPLTLLWPLAVIGGFFIRIPLPVAMATFLPLYALVFQLLINVLGARMFAREYSLTWSWWTPIHVAVTFMPYQLLLGWASARAVVRELQGATNWEKTDHLGAHRRGEPERPLRDLVPSLRPRLSWMANGVTIGLRALTLRAVQARGGALRLRRSLSMAVGPVMLHISGRAAAGGRLALSAAMIAEQRTRTALARQAREAGAAAASSWRTPLADAASLIERLLAPSYAIQERTLRRGLDRLEAYVDSSFGSDRVVQPRPPQVSVVASTIRLTLHVDQVNPDLVAAQDRFLERWRRDPGSGEATLQLREPAPAAVLARPAQRFGSRRQLVLACVSLILAVAATAASPVLPAPATAEDGAASIVRPRP